MATASPSIPVPSGKRPRRPRVLLGVTGSVAAVKGPELAVRLARDLRMDVRVLLTQAGNNFWTKSEHYNPRYWSELQKRLQSTSTEEYIGPIESEQTNNTEEEGRIYVHLSEDEWKSWNRLGDPVLHIDLRDWSDVAVIAPLSAHTLAKLACGLCDDTLSCVIRAWDFGHGSRPGKPLLLAPAMNTAMWEHPLTKSQLDVIQRFWNRVREPKNGIKSVDPEVKTLACGEVGTGALASVEHILDAVKDCII